MGYTLFELFKAANSKLNQEVREANIIEVLDNIKYSHPNHLKCKEKLIVAVATGEMPVSQPTMESFIKKAATVKVSEGFFENFMSKIGNEIKLCPVFEEAINSIKSSTIPDAIALKEQFAEAVVTGGINVSSSFIASYINKLAHNELVVSEGFLESLHQKIIHGEITKSENFLEAIESMDFKAISKVIQATKDAREAKNNPHKQKIKVSEESEKIVKEIVKYCLSHNEYKELVDDFDLIEDGFITIEEQNINSDKQNDFLQGYTKESFIAFKENNTRGEVHKAFEEYCLDSKHAFKLVCAEDFLDFFLDTIEIF